MGDAELMRHELAAAEREDVLRRAAAGLDARPEVVVAWAFGSFPAGRPFRDLDIGVWLTAGYPWHATADAEASVAATLGRPGIAVHVVALNDATPSFRWEVGRHGRLLVERRAGDALAIRARARSEMIDAAERRRTRSIGRRADGA